MANEENQPYLILHKVRGEPAFDIATKLACPICHASLEGWMECEECNGAGFWWIIPTSGHRAYPLRYFNLDYLSEEGSGFTAGWLHLHKNYQAWETTPDHYTTSRSPAPSLSSFISSIVAKVTEKIERRKL